MYRSKLTFIVLFVAIFTTSCSTNTENKDAFDFPDQAKMIADISGNDQGVFIHCVLDQNFTISDNRPFSDTLEARVTGVAGRSAVDSEGTGVGFEAITLDSVAIFSSPEWDIEIVSRIFDFDKPSQFFEEFIHYRGNKVGSNKWMGTWDCYPLHTRGDSIGVISGTWEMEERFD